MLVDLNVVLDVVQKREPHYRASAAVMDRVVCGDVRAVLPAHAITTLHYVVNRYRNREAADQVIDWLLGHFSVASVGHAELLQARGLGWPDFEDAVVAVAAASAGCEVIVTRNVTDFRNAPVPPLTPDEYLLRPEQFSEEPAAY